VNSFVEYYRCPEEYAAFAAGSNLRGSPGYFRFGPDTVCFGRSHSSHFPNHSCKDLKDVSSDIRMVGSLCTLPFDPAEVVDNLRRERYVNRLHKSVTMPGVRKAARKAYGHIRPLLSVPVRKHLQRMHLRGWKDIAFPTWPLDRTVDVLFERLLFLSLKSLGTSGAPFIWFWPEGHSSCAIMTHDVETTSGRDFCSQLMDLDDSCGIKASFQIIPEKRYGISAGFLESIWGRGFEVNVHDLNHDGDLFTDHNEFLRRAARINHYGREYGATGFRSGTLYRNPDWFGALDFSYDMSFPNVGHLDAQRGGCCTVMPFFIGKMLELPLTTTQDYSLFHILGDYSLDLWKQQIALIAEGHGLISCIAHPDYIIEKRAREIYRGLLDHLASLRCEKRVWFTLPCEVDKWWRERSQMKLVRQGDSWRIEGPGSERARIAWAHLGKDRLIYSLEREDGREARLPADLDGAVTCI
jgi:hypothetical protein